MLCCCLVGIRWVDGRVKTHQMSGIIRRHVGDTEFDQYGKLFVGQLRVEVVGRGFLL